MTYFRLKRTLLTLIFCLISWSALAADTIVLSNIIKNEDGTVLGVQTPYGSQNFIAIKGLKDIVVVTEAPTRIEPSNGINKNKIRKTVLALSLDGSLYEISILCVQKSNTDDHLDCSYQSSGMPAFTKNVASVNGNGAGVVVVMKDGSFNFWRLGIGQAGLRDNKTKAIQGRLPGKVISAATNGLSFLALDERGVVWLVSQTKDKDWIDRDLPGKGTISGEFYFKKIDFQSAIKQVSAGVRYTMLSVDGDVYEFGAWHLVPNPRDLADITIPTKVSGLPSIVKALSGPSSSIFLTSQGDLYYKYEPPYYLPELKFENDTFLPSLLSKPTSGEFVATSKKLITGAEIVDFGVFGDVRTDIYLKLRSGEVYSTKIVEPSIEKSACVQGSSTDALLRLAPQSCQKLSK